MDWRFSSFLVALLAILFGFTWAAAEPGLCSATFVKAALRDPSKDGALNCFEFWLYRYQSLTAAFIAGAIALWAGILLSRQTMATEKQVAAQRYEFLEKRIADLQSVLQLAYRITIAADSDLSPNNSIRVSGAPASGIIALHEVAIQVFERELTEIREMVRDFTILIAGASLPEETLTVAGRFRLEARRFVTQCELDLNRRTNLRNLGMGPQPPTEDVKSRSAGTHDARRRLTARMDELSEVIAGILRTLSARIEEARSKAL